MPCEALLKGPGEDLRERGVEGVDELWRGGCEVGGFLGFVVLHDRKPILERCKVGTGGCLSQLEGFYCAARTHHDGQPRGTADSFLRSCEHDVEAPLVKANLLTADATDAVYHYQRFGAYPMHEFRERLDLAENAGAGIDVRDGDELVFLLLERFLHLVQLWPVPNWGFQLRGFHTIRLEAIGEGVGEVSGMEDEDFFTPLCQVGGDEVPAERATAGDDEGLGGRVLGDEEFAEHREGFTEGGDERGGDVRFAGEERSVFARVHNSEGEERPVMAHRLQDCIVELNGPWNQQSRMLRLFRHVCRFWLQGRERNSGQWGGGLGLGVSFSAERGVDLENGSLIQMPRDQRQPLPGGA